MKWFVSMMVKYKDNENYEIFKKKIQDLKYPSMLRIIYNNEKCIKLKYKFLLKVFVYKLYLKNNMRDSRLNNFCIFIIYVLCIGFSLESRRKNRPVSIIKKSGKVYGKTGQILSKAEKIINLWLHWKQENLC